MEAGTKKYWVKFLNPMLALVFMGIIMIIIGAFLPSDTDENITETLRILGAFLILMGFLIITIPYFMNEMKKMNR